MTELTYMNLSSSVAEVETGQLLNVQLGRKQHKEGSWSAMNMCRLWYDCCWGPVRVLPWGQGVTAKEWRHSGFHGAPPLGPSPVSGKSIFLRGWALVPGMKAEKSVDSFTLFPTGSDSDAWWWSGQQWWVRCQQRCLMSGSHGPGAGGGHRNRWGCRVDRGSGSWRGFALLKCIQLKIEYRTCPTFTVFMGLCHFGWSSSLCPSPLSLEVGPPFLPSLCQGFATFAHLLKTYLGYFFIPNGLI